MSSVSATCAEDFGRVARPALGIGVVALIVCAVGAIFSPAAFLRAYLAAYLFFVGFGLGCMAILMIYHLTGGAWGFLTRRILEAGTRTLPLLAALFVPIALGIGYLYPWTQPELVAASRTLQSERLYLNPPFYWLRMALFFGLWSLFAYLLTAWSRAQDRTGDPSLIVRFARISAVGLVVYGITMHFASIDWVMSLEPGFHSTIFGPLVASAQVLSAMALVLVVLAWLVRRPPLVEIVSVEALNDLGNLLFTFLVIWSYMVWFQYMLIWIANLPSDVVWYVSREQGIWPAVALVLLIFHFAVPFFLLLLRVVKQSPRALAAVAGLILAMQLVFDYYQVMPQFSGTTLAEHWMDPLTPLGIGGLWLAYFLWQLGRHPLLPSHDGSGGQAAHLRRHDEEAEAFEESLNHG